MTLPTERCERRLNDHLPPWFRGRLFAIRWLAHHTGWRMACEVLLLQWHQINRKASVIRLEAGTTKNREGRTFQYAALVEMAAAVEALRARHKALQKKRRTVRVRLAGSRGG